MTTDVSQERIEAFISLRKAHNWFVGILACSIFALFYLVNVTSLLFQFTKINWLINAILCVDCFFVIFVVIFLPKSPTERAILAGLNEPIVLLIVAQIIALPLVNLFSDTPIVMPWSPTIAILLSLVLGALEVGRTAYWSLSGSDLITEGERIKELYGFLGAGAGVTAYLIAAFWLRLFIKLGIANIRDDMLIIISLTCIPIIEAIYIDILIHWLERPLRKQQAIIIISVSSILCIATGYRFANLTDWQTFAGEIVLIITLYSLLLSTAIFSIRDSKSRIITITIFLTLIPMILFLLLISDLNPYIGRIGQWLNAHATGILDGVVWLLGAMAGSAIYSVLVWRFGGAYRRSRKKPNINGALLDEITQVPGISLEIAKRIIAHRPYDSYADIVDRVEGVNVKQLAFITQAFSVRN